MEDTNRIIYLSSDLNLNNGMKIVDNLLSLSEEDEKAPIVLFISTYGGRVDSCLAIIDTMRKIPNPVYTVGYGQVMSAGGFILSSGEKGNRSMAPNARLMLHQPAGGTVIDSNGVDVEVGSIYKSTFESLMAENTGRTLEYIRDITVNDLYMNSAEALELGAIDTVL